MGRGIVLLVLLVFLLPGVAWWLWDRSHRPAPSPLDGAAGSPSSGLFFPRPAPESPGDPTTSTANQSAPTDFPSPPAPPAPGGPDEPPTGALVPSVAASTPPVIAEKMRLEITNSPTGTEPRNGKVVLTAVGRNGQGSRFPWTRCSAGPLTAKSRRTRPANS